MSRTRERRAIARRLSAVRTELAFTVVERVRGEVVNCRLSEGDPEFDDVIRFLAGNVDALLAGLEGEEALSAALLAETRLIAGRLIVQGVSLSAMHHAGRVWGAVVWQAVLAAVRPDRPAESEAALEIGGRIWRHVDAVSTAAAHAYLDEVTDRGLLSRKLLDVLLGGRGDAEFADRLARSLHVRLGPVYVAVLVRGDDVPVEDAAERPLATRVVLDRIVEAARGHLLPAAGSLLLGIRLGDLVALYPIANPDEVARVRRHCEALAAALSSEVSIGTSGPHPALQGIGRAYAEAREAVHVAVETGVRGRPVALEEVLVDHLLRASAPAQRILDAALAPLLEYDRAHRADLSETLRAYISAGTNVTGAARRLTVHPNTVVYRLRRIRELTGYDPGSIDELVVLFLGLRLAALRAAS
jgi:hypothetical protein